MINTLLNALMTPAAVATMPPEMPAIVQTYNWHTQCSELAAGAADASTTATLVTYSIVLIPGKAPFNFPDD